MKDKRKESGWRRTGWTLLIGAPLLYFFLACATVVKYPGYDGFPDIASVSDSASFVRLYVENNRTKDGASPHIVLYGTGQHDLGIVEEYGGHFSRLIDIRWFGPSGCMTFTAHYVGLGDLTFHEFCWKPGENLFVRLDDPFVDGGAWSHR